MSPARTEAPAKAPARVLVGGAPLGLADLRAIAAGASVALAPGVAARVAPSRALIDDALRQHRAVYGVNTGFGALQSERVSDLDLERLQLNLLRSPRRCGSCSRSGPTRSPRG